MTAIQEEMKEFYITIISSIHPTVMYNLIRIVENRLHSRQGKYTKLTIRISSPGGIIYHAITACRYLAKTGLEIHTHAFSTVASASVLLYCLGHKRFAAPHTHFNLHPSHFTGVNMPLEIPQLREQLHSLETGQEEAITILSKATGQSISEITDAVTQYRTFNTDEAKNYGLIHEVTDNPFSTEGAETYLLGEYDPPLPVPASSFASLLDPFSTDRPYDPSSGLAMMYAHAVADTNAKEAVRRQQNRQFAIQQQQVVQNTNFGIPLAQWSPTFLY